jgi:hypothetical protein
MSANAAVVATIVEVRRLFLAGAAGGGGMTAVLPP